MNNESDTMEETSGLLQNLIAQFPMGCACMKPMLDENDKMVNFQILFINHLMETILHIPQGFAQGKTVTDAFGTQGQTCVQHLAESARKVQSGENTVCEVNINIFGHIYKASSIFVSNTYLFCFIEDIHLRYFREHYRRSIPREIITSVLLRNNAQKSKQVSHLDKEKEIVSEDIPFKLFSDRCPIEILKSAVNTGESQDGAFRDSLTGLYDRCFAMEALRMYVDYEAMPLSVVLGDVNGLRTINESLGYRAGDDILIHIAKILDAKCRTDDIVARWNDGEFLLVLPYATQADTERVIQRLNADLKCICGEDYTIVTFGYATRDQQPRTANDLLREAEKWIFRKKLLISQSHRNSIIRLLLTTLHAKSAETEEHSDRMANHCRWIAQKMKLTDTMVDDLVLLSMLHDIGKIGIPDCILNKPGALTPQERVVINQHSEIGYRIAQTVPELKQVSQYILAHHERWDGTGYPNGLRGTDIPLESRIIAVVDAYDVMITGRKYRPARTRQEAIAELQRCAGMQFDPNVVALYIKLLTEE